MATSAFPLSTIVEEVPAIDESEIDPAPQLQQRWQPMKLDTEVEPRNSLPTRWLLMKDERPSEPGRRLLPIWLIVSITLFSIVALIALTLPFSEMYHIAFAITKPRADPLWLIATITSVQAVQRRMIIRATWQSLYKNDSLYTPRFVISNVGPLWDTVIATENATFGDIIQLAHLNEDRLTANTIKSVEFFKYVIDRTANRWQFISKIDDDSFLDVPRFYQQYLRPLLSADQTSLMPFADHVAIGRTLSRENFTYPGGQFYTLTKDTVRVLAEQHAANPINNLDEDVLIGKLLHDSGVQWTHVDLPNNIAFDYQAKDLKSQGQAFAKEDADLSGWAHAIGPQSINPHKMRDTEVYLQVAACFDKNGVRKTSD